jgi:hypothetical protein
MAKTDTRIATTSNADSPAALALIAELEADGMVYQPLLILKPPKDEKDLKWTKFQYLGPGTPHDLVDKLSGEVKEQGTHLMKMASGITYRCLGTFQLDRELPKYKIGSFLRFMHLGKIETGNGGRQVNDIAIAGNPADLVPDDEDAPAPTKEKRK